MAGLLAERADRSVLLLEAGPDYGHLREGRWPRDLLDGRVLASTHDWAYTSAAANGRPNHALERAKVIGGCSAHNGCIAIWGSGVDYGRLGRRRQRRLVGRASAPLLRASGGTAARAELHTG